MDLDYYIEMISDEDAEGKGVYEEICHYGDGSEELLQRFGYERKGFDPVIGEAGTITLTSIDPTDRVRDQIWISEEIDCLTDWSDELVTAPITAIAACAASCGSLISQLELPFTLESVGRCAFTDWCALTGIEIPPSVTEIGEYAFGYKRDRNSRDAERYIKLEDFVITGYPGTAAERYAKDNGFEYRVLTC